MRAKKLRVESQRVASLPPYELRVENQQTRKI